MTKKAQAGRKPGSGKNGNAIVEFNYANVSYQIDPARRKVYHRWIEVETAKTCTIMSAFQHSQGSAKQAV
jgi:hypothetical protein